ncbi:MAG: YlmC/YmxH family sporulation protein [Clostridia bacterium]|nr:YlmC/YmxH family sporulation protein [Clostridia bacterium]
MEFNLSELKKKNIINIEDGKDLGKITDMVISFPEGKINGIIAPGKKNSFFGGSELIISFKCVERIGDDAILVRLCEPPTIKEASDEE